MQTPYIIGIAGGSGSGKTTLTQEVQRLIPESLVAHIPHDAYYRDQEQLAMSERVKTNYDHPDSRDRFTDPTPARFVSRENHLSAGV